MDYKGLLQYLHDHNWEGYVSAEYEGNRFTPAGTPMQEKKQVAMQLAYVRACLKEIQG
jgi:sugar phosphate isomerase/epimerase